MADLTFVESSEMLEELKKRYDAGIFYAVKFLDGERSAEDKAFWGQTFTLSGMTRYLDDIISAVVHAERGIDEEDED